MRRPVTDIFPQAVLILCLILSLFVVGDIQKAKAGDPLTVEGEWKVTSSNAFDGVSGYTIVRQGDGYNVIVKKGGEKYYGPGGVGLYYGSSTEIKATSTSSFDALVDMFKGQNVPASAISDLAGKVTTRHMFKLSADGRSLEQAQDGVMVYVYNLTGRLAKYEIEPYYYRATLVRVSGPTKVENRSDRAYQADCGPVDPNRTTPITTDLCPGNLVGMTYFCGGGTGCPYVCCPKGLPYLNHCDCKCYETSDFECHSYSRCQEQPLQ